MDFGFLYMWLYFIVECVDIGYYPIWNSISGYWSNDWSIWMSIC
jgi:hypothetical protein